MARSVPDTRRASRVPLIIAVPFVAFCLAAPAAGSPLASSRTRATELALRSAGFYAGPVLGRDASSAAYPSNALGGVVLRRGAGGWAVRELQLALAWQGFPSGTIDGHFGAHVARAVRWFQRAQGLRADGVAGHATVARLRATPRSPAIRLGWPLLAPVGDVFGPRGDRFHSGIDLLAAYGDPVVAAAPGRVTWASPRDGGWGNLVTIAHAGGVRTMYAHLSSIDVHVGEWVAGGTLLGLVGATGDATGPHLHFEVRVGGGAIDPLRALVPISTG